MPTIELFQTLIKMNAIKNCPVTTEDVNKAEMIFGADILSLKGKLTCCKSTPVVEDVIEIPEELIMQNCKIDLCIVIMYVNECGFMTTIDRTIQCRSAIPIKNCTHGILQLYNSNTLQWRVPCNDGKSHR
jgi:hypothetical protein